MVLCVRIQGDSCLFPLVEDPFETGWVAVHGRLVKGQVTFVVLRIEDLVYCVVSCGLIVDSIDELGAFVRTFSHDTHEGELVLSDLGFRTTETKSSHNCNDFSKYS